MSFTVGENVGPYRIIEQLGQGGMATVYKAYHASLDRYVALKVLHPAFHQDQTFTMRFQREARVVARLEHQNIVPIYDYAEHEGRPYLVMKYIEGDTLKARLNKGPLTAEEIERVVNSVGYALAYAHRQGILHRDIKPSNVMIANDGTMYLADFGLARIAEAGESTMSSDSIMGTPQYISPEQAMGKKDLDAGTDIYSFGVMLYEMVVGRVPFTSDTPFSIIHDHIYTPLPLPMSVNPNVPEPVQRVLLKALAKDRADRYATTEELIKAFKDAWNEAGVPMQGTAIIMGSTIRNAAAQQPAGDKSQSAKVESAVAEQKPAEPVAAPVKKKMSRWAWGGIGALVLLCFALAFSFLFALNRRNKLADNLPAATQLPPPALNQQVPQPTLPPLPPQQLPQVPGNPPAEQGSPNEPPEALAAREFVAQNPNDPMARVQLSLVLWDAQIYQPAFDEALKAANLADPGMPDFFIKSADEYRKHEAWALASSMYVRLLPIYRGNSMPEDLQINMREAAYKTAGQMNLFDARFLDRMETPNLPLTTIIRGRRALFDGNLEEAHRELNQARKIRPDMPEVMLLEAEIALKEGDSKKAQDLLTLLVSEKNTPEWLRVMANELLITIK